MAKKKNNRIQNIISDTTPFAVIEAYKSARTSILFANVEDGCNAIVFTSAEPGEGKTVTCINMAISLAESGKKVLLIDSDMRKPQVAPSLQLQRSPGLSEILAGVSDMDTTPIESFVQKSAYENLDVIAAGVIPPNPAELIACNRTAKLFDKVKPLYDYILIDTPPCLVVTDALLYKKHVMGYVGVVRANVSHVDTTAKLVERLKQIDAHIIGFMLNDRSHKSKNYKRYNSYEKYSRAQK